MSDMSTPPEGQRHEGTPPPPPPPPAGGDWVTNQPGQYGGGYGSAPTSQAGAPLAEWWKRLVAFIIDGLVVGIPAWILFSIIGIGASSQMTVDPATGQPRGMGGLMTALIISSLLYQIAYLVYFAVMNGSESGQTVGKKLMNIRCRKDTGGPLGIGPAALRYVVYAALGLFTCGLGALLDGLWPLWDSKRQALHDKAASSVVVDA